MKLKEKRMSLGLTQEAVAKKLEVTRSAVAMWEAGEAMPRADKLLLLSKLLNCSVDELLE